ncbi:MAG TPA: 30S ribosomal protein S6 [Candidatus Paceibacterota bacterium]|jgi:ribosomal protein S6|nr:30S ribosomal protein S6 [Candidatus Paceibacterota bacterium]
MAKAKVKDSADEVEKNTEEKDIRTSIYEVGYLMVPSIAEENLGGEVTSFKDSLAELGASFISDEYPKMTELAYEMSRSIENKKQKFLYGYFGWVKFECATNEARIIKENLDKNEKLIRYLMIKTVRESTMSPKRPYGRQEGVKRRFAVKSEDAGPINEETIDKEIDALVV